MIGSKQKFHKQLLDWFDASRRDLPWRVPIGSPTGVRPDPYHVLVSESMLQQTQVATVLPYFSRFLKAFPTLQDLATADEQRVLKLWQGLGYYSRARNLRRAAQDVVNRFGGRIPNTVQKLLTLPGIGRYTAGAIASIAFDVAAPAVDGNVMRVLCRLDNLADDPRGKASQSKLWDRADELVASDRPGDFNSAMMELGATICVPKIPRCLMCPVRSHCLAAAAGTMNQIPPSRKSTPPPRLRRAVLCLACERNGQAHFLIEQRPHAGRWAGMWQFVTFEHETDSPRWRDLRKQLGSFEAPRHIARLEHQLTHRRYEFEIFAARCARPKPAAPPRRWVGLSEIGKLPLPRPHALILQMLARPVPPTKSAESR